MKIRTVLVLATAGPLLAGCGIGSEEPTSTPDRSVESEAGAAPARGQEPGEVGGGGEDGVGSGDDDGSADGEPPDLEPGEPGIVFTVDVDERIDQFLEAGEAPLPNGRSEIGQSSHRAITEETHMEWTEDGQWLIHIDYDVTYHGEAGGLGGFYRVNPEVPVGGRPIRCRTRAMTRKRRSTAPSRSRSTRRQPGDLQHSTGWRHQRPLQRWQLRAAGGVRTRSCRGRHRVNELTC